MGPRLPLAGLTVVAIEQAVAAPFCTSRLADAGARVIKVERPEGDFARDYDDVVKGLSSYFVWLNRGKESVVLDLATASGKASLGQLIGDADVVVQNLKPGALARLGFGPDLLVAQNPRLIVCSISGYGETGPMADRKAYDLLIQAATGATAHAAILEALIGRAVTGRGADIRISMFDVMADWLAVPLLHYEGGKSPARLGLRHPSIAPYGVFATRDGQQLLISIQSDREWRIFASIFLEASALGSDPRFISNVQRVANRRETDALVAAAFAQMSDAQAEERLLAADAAFAKVNDMAALARHPHLRRIAVETTAGTVAIPAPAAIFVGDTRDYGAVPALGSSTS
jgi:crotonobetainyl-CoA:carnitine CoA-transferase CaiB-like acyl-CoA transferase